MLQTSFFALVHPCDKDENGGCSQLCIKYGTGHKCACLAGYTLADSGVTCKQSKLIWVKNRDVSWICPNYILIIWRIKLKTFWKYILLCIVIA